MKTLVKVELRRFFARRLVRVLAGVMVLAFLAGGIAAFFVSDRSPSAAVEAEANHQKEVAGCIDSAGRDGVPAANAEAFCEQEVERTDPRFFYSDMPDVLRGQAILFVMIAWLVGASFIGADWHHRGITTLLTWEPRRGRVLTSKIAAAAIGSFSVALFFTAALSIILYPAASLHGSVAGIDWMEQLKVALVVSALGAGAGVLGASLAFISRNTAAALGAGFIYLAVLEGLIRGFKPAWADWLVGENATQVLTSEVELSHPVSTSALLLVAYAAALVVMAWMFFRRREVG
ncbi:MAG: type transport system permease protein [Actinomycetota bacterium]|jgi:hypothetical protein|nr:type transport system permease protein [Actinomycetota bacterium]